MHAQPSQTVQGANWQWEWNLVLGIKNWRAERVDNVAKWASTSHTTHAARVVAVAVIVGRGLCRATVLAAVTAATLGGLSRIFGACYRRIWRQRQDVATH